MTIWVIASCSPSLLPSPGVNWFLNFSGIFPAGDHSPSRVMPPAVCLLPHLYLPSNFKCPGFSRHGSVNSQLWDARELPSHSCRPGSPPKLLRQLWSLARGQGTLPSAYKISLLSIFKQPLQPLASKYRISWNSVGCSCCSSEDRLGVPVRYTSRWVQLPLTLPPPSHQYVKLSLPPMDKSWLIMVCDPLMCC